jgi:ABC-type branched-subunit amino acid transport system substrate-binding protein
MLTSIKFSRRNLFIGLAIAIIISDSIIYFAEIKNKEIYSNWIIGINASIAATLATFVVYRHKNLHGLYGKTHAALAIGLILWLSADIIWAVYHIALEIVPPVPSAADFLWLSAYGFVAYYLYMTYAEFHKKFNFSNKALIVSVIASIFFLSYIIAITVNLSDLSSLRGVAMFSVIVAYPILDAILIVPAIVILVNFRKEPLWFTPWICESLGIFLIAISDSWFALVVLTSLVEQVWISALFFAAHYLVIAAGLLWFMKFLIISGGNESDSKQEEEMLAVNNKKNNNNTSSISANNNNNSNNPDRIIGKEKVERRRKGKILVLVGSRAIPAVVVIPMAIIVAVVGVIIIYSFYPYSLQTLFSSFAIGNSEVVIPAPAGSNQIVTLGAILPITGISSSLGESEEAALKIAIKDINEYFSNTTNSSKTGVGLIIEDTQSNPAVSLEKLKHLAAKGIKIVIGPGTSAVLQAIQDYATKNGILLISPSSTAPSLAIRNDNVFRFVPDDTHQAQAISRQIWNDGIRVIIPFWRTDVYGNDLVSAMKKSFQQLGGIVADGIGYKPYTGDFSASLNRINFIIWDQHLKALSSKLNQAISQYGVNKVGVYLVVFDEVAPIFIQAQSHPVLSMVKWYGSDGSAMNNKLIRNHEAAIFAVKTGFANPIYAVENDNDNRFKRFEAQIHEQIERTPRSYAGVAYDILWVAALAENNTKATHDINYLKNTIVKIADSYNGITGNTTLNQFGDRKYGDYDFWAIRNSSNNNSNSNDAFTWKRIGKYTYDTRTKEEHIQNMEPIR